MSGLGGTGEWQVVEVYSTFLRIRGEMLIAPPLRLSDEVNRLGEFLELRNTTAEPVVTSYPVVSTTETNTTIAKASIVMLLPDGGPPQANSMMWREKIRHQVVLNTTAFSLAADVHLDARETLLNRVEHGPREFIPLTRISAVIVASMAGTPQTFTRDFALLNPASIISFSDRGEIPSS